MAKKTIKAQMKQRRDTKANWAATNPVLLDGELGIVSDDPNLYKVGDGATAWNDLPFRGCDGTLAQELGTSPNAVISQKIVSEKLTELESESLSKNEFNGLLNKIEITKADVLRIPYVLFPNRNYKIVNNIGVLTKFNAIKEDCSEITIAQIPNGQSATFQVPSKCVYFQFYAAVQGGYFEVGEDVDYR